MWYTSTSPYEAADSRMAGRPNTPTANRRDSGDYFSTRAKESPTMVAAAAAPQSYRREYSEHAYTPYARDEDDCPSYYSQTPTLVHRAPTMGSPPSNNNSNHSAPHRYYVASASEQSQGFARPQSRQTERAVEGNAAAQTQRRAHTPSFSRPPAIRIVPMSNDDDAVQGDRTPQAKTRTPNFGTPYPQPNKGTPTSQGRSPNVINTLPAGSDSNSGTASISNTNLLSKFATQVSKPARDLSDRDAMQQGASDKNRKVIINKPRTPKPEDYANVVHPAHKNSSVPLLPYCVPAHRSRHLLLLDLDETLVHASATPTSHDLKFTVEMETQKIQIFVKYRPFMMEFLRAAASLFEVGVFTASLSKYADQVLDDIDPRRELITHRLFREHCTQVDGSYVKDLSILGRHIHNVILVDNSPVSFLFHPENSIQCTSWFDDMSCTELRSYIPLLERLARAPSVIPVIAQFKERKQLML